MQLSATVRGGSLAELNSAAEAACDKFYGTTPYVIVDQPWNAAGVDQVDESGNPVTFAVTIQATPAA